MEIRNVSRNFLDQNGEAMEYTVEPTSDLDTRLRTHGSTGTGISELFPYMVIGGPFTVWDLRIFTIRIEPHTSY